MKQKYFLFIFFVFILPVSLASTLSLSPTQLDFAGKSGEKICKNITVKTEEMQIIEINDLWAKKGIQEKMLSLHKLKSKDLDLELEYEKNFEIDGKRNINLCLIGKNKGNYHGALLFRIKEKPIQVGLWLNVSLDGNEFIHLNSNAIKNSNHLERTPVILFIILGIIFVGLLFTYRRQKNNKIS